MAYVRLLSAWKNQDLNQIEEILAPELYAAFYSYETVKIFNRHDIMRIFRERFTQLHEWNFDVHYQAKRHDQEIVASTITRENAKGLVTERAFTILTFARTDKGNQLIRIHMETELTI